MEENKQLIKNVVLGAIKGYLKKECDITLPDNQQNINVINPAEMLETLKEMGLSQAAIQDVKRQAEFWTKIVQLQVQFLEEGFDSLNDSISNVAYQIHWDKIAKARTLQEQFEKRIAEEDIDEIRLLRKDAETYLSELQSDIETRIKVCESVPKKRKPLFGSTFRNVESALKELKEVLPVYEQTVNLLHLMELTLGKEDSAEKSLQTAMEFLQTKFSIQDKEKNRMYTLTDDDYWWTEPQKYCDHMKQCIQDRATYKRS